MIFRVMNKVMKKKKKQGNSIVIQSVNENVIPIKLKQKFKKGSFYCPFFLCLKNYKLILFKIKKSCRIYLDVLLN